MKHALTALILAAGLAASAAAEDTTALQVAPSDQIIYPDASQILNKTEPKAPAAAKPSPLPSTQPLVASVPVPAATAAGALPARGWYLRWLFDSEASARAWADASGRPVRLRQVAGRWEALQGPLDPAALKPALEGQAGWAVLLRL